MDEAWYSGSALITFIVSCKIWFLIYGICLLTWDMLFTIFPTTLLGLSCLYFLIRYLRVPLPPAPLISEVFGEDANVLIDKYRKNRTGMDLTFIPTTSRLASVNSSPGNSHHHLLESGSIEKPYTMWIIGHRGAGLDAPENSLSAFRLCKSRGCLAVEFDVALTKDNVAVVFHDDNLFRIASINRNIRDITWEELRQVDISINHPLGNKFRGERIPSFDEAIVACLELDLRFFIDLKDADSRMVEVVLEAYLKYGEAMYKRAVVSSFFPQLIYQIRKRDHRIIGCMAWRPSFNEYEGWNGDLQNLECRHHLFITRWLALVQDMILKWALHDFIWWFIGLSALLINKDGITKEDTSHWMKKGIRIFAWTVNNPIEKLHLTHNFQMGYLTDTLDGGDLKIPSVISSSMLLPKDSETHTEEPHIFQSPVNLNNIKNLSESLKTDLNLLIPNPTPSQPKTTNN